MRQPRASVEALSADHEATLIAQIVEQPEDLALRLVLADLLMERGDVRGELLRIGVEMASLSVNSAEYAELHGRSRALIEPNAAHLAGELGALAPDHWITGGFVTSVTMSASAFAADGERVFRAQPVERLLLDPVSHESIAELARQPHLALVRELHLGSGRGDKTVPVTVAPLAKARLDRLRVLQLWGAQVADDSGFAGLQGPQLRQLRVIGELTATSLHALLHNRAIFDALEEFVLLARSTGDASLADLEMPNARRIGLGNTKCVSDEVLARLIRRMPRLERFDSWRAGPLAFRALVEQGTLRALSIADRIDLDLLDALLELPLLEELDLQFWMLDDDEHAHFRRALERLPADRPLRRIRLSAATSRHLPPRFHLF